MLFNVLLMIGTVAAAISGALCAIKHRMDLSGVILLAFIVGNGGGTIRDTMLHVPIFWFTETQFLWATVAAGILTFLLSYDHHFKHRAESLNKLLLWFDAVGLATFAIAGTQKALSLGTPAVGAIVLGMLTAVGGGVIRDVLCNDVPVIFRRQLYATPALIGATTFVAMTDYLPGHHGLALFFSTAIVIILRCMAMQADWHLPMAK